MNVIGLDEVREGNLRRLAAYLLAMPEGAPRFHMLAFSDHWSHFATHCGTGGCAIGHGPCAGIEKNFWETWDEYADRVFIPARHFARCSWCFEGRWSDTDDTPRGAAGRSVPGRARYLSQSAAVITTGPSCQTSSPVFGLRT